MQCYFATTCEIVHLCFFPQRLKKAIWGLYVRDGL